MIIDLDVSVALVISLQEVKLYENDILTNCEFATKLKLSGSTISGIRVISVSRL